MMDNDAWSQSKGRNQFDSKLLKIRTNGYNTNAETRRMAMWAIK